MEWLDVESLGDLRQEGICKRGHRRLSPLTTMKNTNVLGVVAVDTILVQPLERLVFERLYVAMIGETRIHLL